MHGLIKLHKPSNTISPTVNWQEVPTYKFAKFLTPQKLIKQLISLPKSYVTNYINYIYLINYIYIIDFSNNTKLCSFDTTNM
jgi:hypothetical protein